MSSKSNRNKVSNRSTYEQQRNSLIQLIETQYPKKANGDFNQTKVTPVLMLMSKNSPLMIYFGINGYENLLTKYYELKNEIAAEQLALQNQNHAVNYINQESANDIFARIEQLRIQSENIRRQIENLRSESESLSMMLSSPNEFGIQNQIPHLTSQKANINQTVSNLQRNANALNRHISNLQQSMIPPSRSGGSIRRKSSKKKRSVKK